MFGSRSLTMYAITALVLVVCSAAPAKVDFTGYHVIRMLPKTQEQVDFLVNLEHMKIDHLQKLSDELDFMKGASFSNERAEVLVNPANIRLLEQELSSRQIHHETVVENYQELLDGQHDTDTAFEESSEAYSQSTILSTRRYHTYDEIVYYMRNVCTKGGNPCERVYIGASYEGRRMYAVKIGNDDPRKKVIWIDGGIHAREWIAPATATYLLGKLVERSAESQRLLSKYVFYVMPSMNPDGYSYTWTNNRMWRKTRTYNYNSNCKGTDPNRNWSFKWGGVGTSSNPCSNTYHGSYAFSEPCVRVTSYYLMGLRRRLHLYLSLHSYSQLWLTPWAHTKSLPANYAELARVGRLAASSQLRIAGSKYRVGATSRILYKCSGASSEWVKGVLRTPYTFTVELPDTGRYGFALPASMIDVTARGMWAALNTLVNNLR